MRVGTPEHDDYLRGLMKLPRHAMPRQDSPRPAAAPLTDAMRSRLLSNAVQTVWAELGEPTDSDEQAIFDCRVDGLYSAALDIETESNAPEHVRAARSRERMMLMPGIRAFLGLGPIE